MCVYVLLGGARESVGWQAQLTWAVQLVGQPQRECSLWLRHGRLMLRFMLMSCASDKSGRHNGLLPQPGRGTINHTTLTSCCTSSGRRMVCLSDGSRPSAASRTLGTPSASSSMTGCGGMTTEHQSHNQHQQNIVGGGVVRCTSSHLLAGAFGHAPAQHTTGPSTVQTDLLSQKHCWLHALSTTTIWYAMHEQTGYKHHW